AGDLEARRVLALGRSAKAGLVSEVGVQLVLAGKYLRPRLLDFGVGDDPPTQDQRDGQAAHEDLLLERNLGTRRCREQLSADSPRRGRYTRADGCYHHR